MPEADPPVRGGQVLGKSRKFSVRVRFDRQCPDFYPSAVCSHTCFAIGVSFRRIGLRLWERSHRVDYHVACEMIKSAS